MNLSVSNEKNHFSETKKHVAIILKEKLANRESLNFYL